VHESGRTRITRLFLAAGTVIRKEMLGPDAECRLRHEAALLDRLRGVAGVGQPAEAPRFPDSVMLADAGRTIVLGDDGSPCLLDFALATSAEHGHGCRPPSSGKSA
jgi:hypothetical protein